MNKKKILFLTATRADYGKMKPLMLAIEESKDFECNIFVTGMHTLKEFGSTKTEIFKDRFRNIHVYMNQIIEEPMDLVLANTINGFSRYLRELNPDMIVVHGDRVEALAGAISGAMNNILVAHIEGGEVSGTIDESIRHAISKLSHIHFVSNDDAKKRLLQLGENESSIYVIGSPDIDIIMDIPTLTIEEVKDRYDITFDEYSVLIYHPVTTEINDLRYNIKQLVDATFLSDDNFIIINPNNDSGYNIILEEFRRFDNYSKVKKFPSMRFEYFIELLRNAKYMIGNSSSGIHEAPVIGLPCVNIGTRQENRFSHETIINCSDDTNQILAAIDNAKRIKKIKPSTYFGNGKSRDKFITIISKPDIWETPKQKSFWNISFGG